MATITESPTIAGVHLVDPQVFGDERGLLRRDLPAGVDPLRTGDDPGQPG